MINQTRRAKSKGRKKAELRNLKNCPFAAKERKEHKDKSSPFFARFAFLCGNIPFSLRNSAFFRPSAFGLRA
jgi:hypothetical protein